MHNLKYPILLLAIPNILQSSQRDITHIYTVKILRNTQNPSITEPSFVHTTENTSWMERKRIIPVEKCLNGELAEPSSFQEPEMQSFTTNRSKNATKEQC
jgi:hypothetical protein